MILYLTNVYGQSLEFFKILFQVIILMGQIKFSLFRSSLVCFSSTTVSTRHPPSSMVGRCPGEENTDATRQGADTASPPCFLTSSGLGQSKFECVELRKFIDYRIYCSFKQMNPPKQTSGLPKIPVKKL